VVYGGASWVTEQRSTRFDFSTPLDAKIPFVPTAAIAYLLLMPLLWAAPIMLRTPAAIRQFAKSLQILILLSGIGFLLLPSNDPIVPTTLGGLEGLVFNFADAINLKHNLFPSLHVGMAVVCAHAYGQHLSPLATCLCWAAATGIALATLLTYQHYIADVVAGGATGWLVASYMPRCPNLSA
jgi:membrane-associated phospholipid phosphatase